MSLLAGILGQNKQDKIAKENLAFQREMATTGVQKRVEDARSAGVHPAAALGAQIAMPSPVSVGDSLGPALHNAGQDISRAVSAGATASDRGTAQYTAAVQALNLERLGLENAEIRSRLARSTAPGTPPPVPTFDQRWGMPGQTSSGAPTNVPGIALVNERPLERSVDPSNPSGEPGHVADLGWSLTPGGSYYPLPSKEAQERMEDNPIAQAFHFLRNNLLPWQYGGQISHPPIPPPEGMRWTYSVISGWQLRPLSEYRRGRFRNPDGSTWRYQPPR